MIEIEPVIQLEQIQQQMWDAYVRPAIWRGIGMALLTAAGAIAWRFVKAGALVLWNQFFGGPPRLW